MEIFTVREVAELDDLAVRVLDKLKEVERLSGAAVLALHGDLGSGKTTFVQVLGRKLGVSEIVVSPTFVVMKHYELADEQYGFTDLYHLDCYRIEDADEMRPLHFSDVLAEERGLIVIEWAERIEALLPLETLHVSFTITAEARTITLSTSKIH